MSILDNLKNEALKHFPGQDNAVAQAAVGVIEQQGGLGTLAQRFREKGLSGIVDSWISTGANQQIGSGEIQNVLGQPQLQQIADRFGIPREAVAEKLAQVLPQVVDKMTPNGTLQKTA
jgi:uncharacterized protein YidB (DUF937 family)